MIQAIDLHLHMWANGQIDPLVWMFFVRGCFLFLMGLWMFREPMLCGGRNRTLHVALGVYFIVNGVNVMNRAMQRMESIADSAGRLPVSALIVTETILLSVTILVFIKMGYDYYLYKTQERMKIKRQCEHDCHVVRNGNGTGKGVTPNGGN